MGALFNKVALNSDIKRWDRGGREVYSRAHSSAARCATSRIKPALFLREITPVLKVVKRSCFFSLLMMFKPSPFGSLRAGGLSREVLQQQRILTPAVITEPFHNDAFTLVRLPMLIVGAIRELPAIGG